jgi:fatty acid desaturase
MTTPLHETPVEALEARIGSLKPVIDAIPESVYDNPTWRGVAYFSRDAAIYAALLVALVYVSNVFAVLAIEVVMALVVSALFIVGHDAAHGSLFKSKRTTPTPSARVTTSSGTP